MKLKEYRVLVLMFIIGRKGITSSFDIQQLLISFKCPVMSLDFIKMMVDEKLIDEIKEHTEVGKLLYEINKEHCSTLLDKKNIDDVINMLGKTETKIKLLGVFKEKVLSNSLNY